MAGRKTGIAYSSLNKVELVHGGKPFFARLEQMIRSAKSFIYLQTYIFDYDETGRRIAGELKSAAARGVKVYLLADGYASGRIPKFFIEEIRMAGINFRFFNPLFKSKRFYFGRRLHHKIVVTDTRYAMVGGINISNKYNDMPGKKAWLDFALYLEGEAAKELCLICWKTWKNYPLKWQQSPCDQQEVEFDIQPGETSGVSVIRNDWVRRKNEISSSYVYMLRNARSHIVILCSYFLPGRFLRRQISYAVKKGVKIKVITAGISDVMLAKYAERFMYKWLLKRNIELYEYQPNILHGKIAVCDNEWITIGSYNINNISAYASIELNLNVRNKDFAMETEKMLTGIAEKDCIRITEEYYKHTNNIFKKLARWFSYQFIRFVFFIFTFYFKHSK